MAIFFEEIYEDKVAIFMIFIISFSSKEVFEMCYPFKFIENKEEYETNISNLPCGIFTRHLQVKDNGIVLG